MSLYPPFLKWGKYKSTDPDKPDVLNIEVTETDTFETEYSICVVSKVDDESMAIPLHNFGSNNLQCLNLWKKGIKEGKIKVGKKFRILTWKGTSKNNFPIRRYDLVF